MKYIFCVVLSRSVCMCVSLQLWINLTQTISSDWFQSSRQPKLALVAFGRHFDKNRFNQLEEMFYWLFSLVLFPLQSISRWCLLPSMSEFSFFMIITLRKYSNKHKFLLSYILFIFLSSFETSAFVFSPSSFSFLISERFSSHCWDC